ncbi:SusC/RagA family TonB-linked outer membrane protein [Polaribacter cellanae]|uniref:TonB-dependent receptor n=1 Tax=Polaribacter cellanae TaxID=2818493 RepID=A0A975CRF8_9FLAO|nr:TonB-dependent receptor [Polaribacter cellanae]QTE22557.1 TonB-dependent receptor [Polaribacter cellanae]
MKTFIFLMCTTVFSFNVKNTIAQNKVYIESDKEITIDQVFKIIKTQSDFNFVYPKNLFKKTPKVRVKKGEIEITELLKNSLSNKNVTFEIIKNHTIIIKRKPIDKIREKIQQIITGLVTDDVDNPLPGASIHIKGTSKGTESDFDGNFSIEVANDNAMLVISYIGYTTKEVAIKDKKQIVVKLKEDAGQLEEVVVIGYGKQSKAKVIGAVSKIDAKQLNKVASVSLDQQLAGKISGVVVNQSNGQPGASSNISIRGVGTLTAGTNPLIVVDGFPLSEGSSLNSINTNDIENISILKDAASAAIYGSRAANGVVLVTTKKGKSNQETKITLDTYVGFQQQSSGVELVDAYQHAQFLKEARDWGYVSKDPSNRSASDPNSVRVTKKLNGRNIDGRELNLDFLQPYLNRQTGLTNTNWMDVAFRTAPMYNYNLAASGGNKKTNYYASLGYFNQEGVVIGTDLKRYSASFNLSSKINNKIKFGILLNPSFTILNSKNQGSRSSGALGLLPLSFPYYSPYKTDGSLNISEQVISEQRELEGVRINGTPVENLLATSTKVIDHKKRFRVFGNMFVEAKILNNLTYKLLLGGDYDAYNKNYYYPSDVGSYRRPAPRNDANGQETKQFRYNYLVENTLNYSLEINNHSFDILAGHTFQKEFNNFTKVTGTGYPDDNIQNIAGASAYSADYNSSIWTLESYLARIQYDYQTKYLISAAIRTDGSSRFGVNNRWGSFPSLSAGWIFTKESFFPENDILNFGKLSASWGKTGNNQIGNYGSQALITDSNYILNDALAPGFITTSSPNPNLGWEVASSLNIGLDFRLFNKLNISTAYYKTNTTDLLLNLPVPQQTGYNTVLANIGEMENKGFEIDLSANNLKLGALNIGFNANITTYKNKVLALGPDQEEIRTGRDENFVTKIGQSIAEIYGYEIEGVYKTQKEIDNSPHLSGTLTGDYKVKDINKDGKINTSDKVSKGSFLPDFTYGFGANVAYNNFNFSFDFTGVAGRTLMDGDMASLTEAGEGFSVPTTYYFENRYHPTNNPNGFLGQPNFGNFSNSRKQLRSSSVVEKNNGDYLRLRNIRLAYNFSPSVLKAIKVSSFQLYLSANNVFTLTKYRGWNPDGTSSNVLTSGYNTGANYPIARTFLIGARIQL